MLSRGPLALHKMESVIVARVLEAIAKHFCMTEQAPQTLVDTIWCL